MLTIAKKTPNMILGHDEPKIIETKCLTCNQDCISETVRIELRTGEITVQSLQMGSVFAM